MTGGLMDFRPSPYSIEKDVRAVLGRMGKRDASTAECRAWARSLIIALVPEWSPGQPLAFDHARRVGEAFEKLVASPRPRIADVLPAKPGRRALVGVSG